MQAFAAIPALQSLVQDGLFIAVGVALVCGLRLMFLGVPVGDKLLALLPSRYSYGLLQIDNLYCVQYSQWWCPVWFSHRWVQTVPSHVHVRRLWWGKLLRTRRNWRISGFTADLAEAQLQLARLKARHAGTSSRLPSRRMTQA